MPHTVAVAGASGYAGGELLRLLAAHPEFEVTTVTANQNAGQPLIALQPQLRSLAHLTLVETTPEALAGHDVVFTALPHGKSGALTAQLPDDVLVVDCGADHRLTDEAAWERFYGSEFSGAWASGAVTLALAPAVRAGLVDATDLVSVLAVGPSGAGKALAPHLLASELMGSASAYGVGGTHRHVPEIQQNLVVAGAERVSISFTPVLVPMSRGILATSTATLSPGVSEHDVRTAYEQAYAAEPFVHVLPAGQFPRTADTVGANTALIGLAVDADADRLVVVSAIDNLAKGTAGAAVQSANIALGLPETTGLTVNGVAP
jgi:N-acetyl-gamma-glutamyl-phosphate reductase